MSEMLVALCLLIFVGLLFGAIFLSQRYSWAKGGAPFIRWISKIVDITIEHWELDRHYAAISDVISRSATLVEALSIDGADFRAARLQVRDLVRDLHRVLHPGHEADDLDMDVPVAAYLFLISHKETALIIASIQAGHQSLEVKKATNLAIDVLGEIVSRDTKLSRQYFQHLIYGINKSLVLIKKHGTDKKTLKKVTSTLFRVYKLTKAYRHRRGLKNLTEAEFYAKVVDVFGTLSKLHTGE